MIEIQRIIKYVAIGFAFFLIVSIFSMIMYGIISIGNAFNIADGDSVSGELENIDVNNNIDVIDIDIESSNIIFKEGTILKIETNNKYIRTRENNNRLVITEEKHSWLNKSEVSDLVIYIPIDYYFENVSIENGAGRVDIEVLHVGKLNLDLGAGNVKIENLTILNNAEIDGGAGDITIVNSKINNLDLDMGVGKIRLTSMLTGNNDIDAGIGEFVLNLMGTIDDYKIILDKGLGNATLDGEKIKDSIYYGNGANLINVSGGVGSIKINMVNE